MLINYVKTTLCARLSAYTKDVSETTGVPPDQVLSIFLSTENAIKVNILSIRIKELADERPINLNLVCDLLAEISVRISGMEENSVVWAIRDVRPRINEVQQILTG